MSIKWFNRSVLTGGGLTALDAVLTLSGDETSMAVTGDRAFTYTSEGLFFTHEFEAGATDTEAPPLVIAADDGGGVWRLKRWSDSAPVGVPYLWLTDVAPAQHMFVYGQGLSATVYPELFSVLGYTFGGSDGTFYLPNPQGLGIRITDNGAGVDTLAASRTDRGDGTTGDAVGTKQGDGNKSHLHVVDPPNTNTSSDTHRHSITLYGYGQAASGSGKTVIRESGTFYTAYDTHSHTVNIAAFNSGYSGNSEATMKNMNFNLIIKYE